MPNFKEKIVIFLKEVKQEMKKVTWLSKKELIRYTMLVIGVSFFVAIILGGLDNVFRFILFSFAF